MMLKNNDERRTFLLDPKNWIVKDSLPTLGIRVLEIKITNSISLTNLKRKSHKKTKKMVIWNTLIVFKLEIISNLIWKMIFINWLMEKSQNHHYQWIMQ